MITIAWDVDDVLNNLTESWLNYYNLQHNTAFRYDNITKNPPHEILGISFEKYVESLDEFRLSEYALQLSPNKEVLEFMHKYNAKFNHIALTATSAHTAHNSSYWVMKYFFRHIYSYNIIPAKREYQTFIKYSNKKDFLLAHPDIKIFVDDCIQNVNDAGSAGVKAYLLKQPWNNGMEINEILKDIERSMI